MNLQKRTNEAVAKDVNLLVELGWKRDETPPYENDLFYHKSGKTAIVFLTSSPEYLDRPMLKRFMFDENGDRINKEIVNPFSF
jgi:hypothetical protein